MDKILMIDYVDERSGKYIRTIVDDFEFCVREGIAYFDSNGRPCSIPVESISQMYTVCG